MTLVILIVWGVISILLKAFGHISISDNYIGMTILLAVMYVEAVVEKRGRKEP